MTLMQAVLFSLSQQLQENQEKLLIKQIQACLMMDQHLKQQSQKLI